MAFIWGHKQGDNWLLFGGAAGLLLTVEKVLIVTRLTLVAGSLTHGWAVISYSLCIHEDSNTIPSNWMEVSFPVLVYTGWQHVLRCVFVWAESPLPCNWLKQGSLRIFQQYSTESGAFLFKDSKRPGETRDWSTLTDVQSLIVRSFCTIKGL